MSMFKRNFCALWLIVGAAQMATAGQWTQLLPFENVSKVRYNRLTQIYWFGTSSNGVWRFDGREFARFVPIAMHGIADSTITALEIEEAGDTLWVGTPSGLFSYHELSRTWVYYQLGNITALLIDASGALWYGTADGEVGKQSSRGWIRCGNADFARIRCLVQQGTRIYIGTDGAGLYVCDCREVASCNLSPVALPNVDVVIKAIAIDRHGNKWLGTSGGVCWLDSLDNFKQCLTTAAGLADNTVNAIWIEAYQNDDEKWFGTNNGVSVLDSTNSLWRTFKVQNSGLAANLVVDMIGDNDGNLWFTFQDFRGVSKLDNNWSELITADCIMANCPRSDFVQAIERDRFGHLWAGTDAGEVEVLDRGKWKLVKLDDGRCSQRPITVSDFLSDRDSVWVATTGCGIFKVAADATLRVSAKIIRFPETPQFPDNRVFALAKSKNNDTLWAGTYAGLARIVTRPAIKIDKVFFRNRIVTALAYDRQDRLWIGTNAGVMIYDQGKILLKPIDQLGLGGVAINTIARDSSGAMWIGTNAGVARFDQTGQLATFTSREGLPDDRIFNLGVAPNRMVWCGTVNGVAAFDGEKWTAYTIEDGLSDNFIRQIAFGPGEVVWFATYGGGISRYRRTPIGPNTYIESTFSIITENNATFRYSGSDFNTPVLNLRYQYALDGGNWSSITPATFAILTVDTDGLHTFYVRAIDKDGNFDASPAKFRFHKVRFQHGGAATIVDSTRVQKFGSLRIYVPPNALLEGASIHAKPVEIDTAGLARQKLSFTGIAYNLAPADVKIKQNKPLTLTIIYSGTIAPQDERKLAIYRRDDKWKPIGGAIDTKRHEITTTITELNTVALFKELGRADFIPVAGISNVSAQPRILSPKGGGFLEKVTVSFNLGDLANVTAKIYNLSGRLVSVLCENRSMNPGRNVIEWNGRDYNNTICSSGLYIVTIESAGSMATKQVVVMNEM